MIVLFAAFEFAVKMHVIEIDHIGNEYRQVDAQEQIYEYRSNPHRVSPLLLDVISSNIHKLLCIVSRQIVNHNFTRGRVMISYEPLWRTMKARGVSTYKLIHTHGINPNTITCLKHGRYISTYTLERLCVILGCTPNDIMEITREQDQG